jgi:ASTRA-associated protein 1
VFHEHLHDTLTFGRHGRDHRLRVWQLKELDFNNLDARLPVEGELPDMRREPWLLHSLSVNTLNFCPFAMCYDQDKSEELSQGSASNPLTSTLEACLPYDVTSLSLQPDSTNRPILISVSNALDSGAIDFFNLPSERRVYTLPADKEIKTGMVMALSLSKHSSDEQLIVVSGYESGHVMVHLAQSNVGGEPWSWKKVLVSQPHSQPLLSLDVSQTESSFFTSSADAIITKFAIPTNASTPEVVEMSKKVLNTKHAGQQSLRMRSDGKIFATAGWDARIRVYSAKAMRELAVLKWHKDGCYAVAFASINPEKDRSSTPAISNGRDVVPAHQGSALDAIKEQRSVRAQNTHWLAAGGKDGKISLWDIY